MPSLATYHSDTADGTGTVQSQRPLFVMHGSNYPHGPFNHDSMISLSSSEFLAAVKRQADPWPLFTCKDPDPFDPVHTRAWNTSSGIANAREALRCPDSVSAAFFV